MKIGFFRTDSDLLYHDEVHGPLFTQVAGTMKLLLTKYPSAAISYQGIQRVETLPVPEAALREAVLNAIIHKDYGPVNRTTFSHTTDGTVVRRTPNLVKFREDPDAMLVMALEGYDEVTGKPPASAATGWVLTGSNASDGSRPEGRSSRPTATAG